MSDVASRLNFSGMDGRADSAAPFFDREFADGETAILAASIVARTANDVRLLTTEPANKPLGGLPKRLIDIMISSIAVILLAPLLLMIAVLVCAFVGAPIIYPQRRIGLNGTVFTCYKFRTMVTDADVALEDYLAANPEAAEEWRDTQKLKDDPRVCSLGRLLRRSSLDELPQLFNVLRGDMSIVGPRPIVASELPRYGVHAHRCFRARPGLSGIWQVNGRNRVEYRRRVVLDRYYARHWSIWLDLAILLKTVPALLKFDETA